QPRCQRPHPLGLTGQWPDRSARPGQCARDPRGARARARTGRARGLYRDCLTSSALFHYRSPYVQRAPYGDQVMLTPKQHELLHFIQQRLDASGISPSFEEMKEALGLKSKSGIHRLISALEERGFLRRLPNRARALEVLKLPEAARAKAPSDHNVLPLRKPAAARPIAANDIIEVPLHGRIAAGVPIEAFEDHNQLSVPAALLGSGEHYALEVSGDSMIE